MTINETQRPFFSLVTVTKDNLSGLNVTERSIGQQSSDNFEWIVIDRNSTDGTKEYNPEIPCDFLSEPDEGIYDAMNKGLQKARGEYILFLNAGDKFAAPDILAYIREQLTEMQFRPAFVYGDAWEERPGDEPVFKPARTIRHISYGMVTHHQAMFYEKDALGHLTYNTNYKIAADYDFTLRFVMSQPQSEAAVYIPKAICVFESGGISQKQVRRGRAEQFRIRQDLKTVSTARNYLIYYTQTCAMLFRRLFPHLYWLVRRQV